MVQILHEVTKEFVPGGLITNKRKTKFDEGEAKPDFSMDSTSDKLEHLISQYS